MAAPGGASPLERAAQFSYVFLDEMHSLVDEPSAVTPRRLVPAVRRAVLTGLVVFGTIIGTLGKLGTSVGVSAAM
jgi:hypothetical protein